jgi:hypothetical protein
MHRRELLSLLGGLTAGSALAALSPDELLARGVRAHDKTRRTTGPIGPFTPHQAATLDRATELILPATDTPGAHAAGVTGFIAVIVGEWDTPEDRDHFMSGLTSLDAKSRERFGKDFVDGTETDQVALLTALDSEVQAMRGRHENVNANFYHRLKGLTLYGYYTSEVGATQELHNQVIPGRYDGCAPFTGNPHG